MNRRDPEPRAPSSEFFIRLVALLQRRFMMRYGQQPADAADLAQEVMVKLLGKLARSNERYRDLTGLALSLTHDVWYAAVRRRSRELVGSLAEAMDDDAEGQAVAVVGGAVRFEQVLEDLAPRLRAEALMLAHALLQEGVTIKSAAQSLGVSVRTAYSLRQELLLVLQSRLRS